MATAESSAGARTLRCVVVTPEKAVLNAAVDFVAVPLYDGELGVLPGRQPLIGRLGSGELRIMQGKTTRRYYVDGGFVQVRDDVVTLLTSKAIPAEELRVEVAEAALREAQKTATTPEEQEARQKAQHRARVQLRMALKNAEESSFPMGDLSPSPLRTQ
jgi:F-type H+-transporting ATPase subunit epsilon